MKKVIITFLALSTLAVQSCSDAKTEETTENKETANETSNENEVAEEAIVMVDGYHYYGIKEMTSEGAVTVEEMKSIIDSTGSFSGKIATSLNGVCKKAGCWVTIENPNGDPIRVVFGEHDFFVPIDTPEGKEVIIDGMAMIDTTSIEMQKHFLDDAVEAGETVTQEQYDAITEPLVEVSFNASGILIKP